MDNWLYSTVNAFRMRWTPTGVVREPTGPNNAQWGVTQDDDGKVWFQDGASGLPGYFQFPIHYGNFATPDQFEPDLEIVWGAPHLIGDVQAGLPGTRMPDGTVIYADGRGRQRRLPRRSAAARSRSATIFYGEVGRPRSCAALRPVKTEGLHAAPQRLSAAVRVHPLARSALPSGRRRNRARRHRSTSWTCTAAIIQEGAVDAGGQYLRAKIEQYQLDKVVGHGRIWRLTLRRHGARPTQPRMLQETAAQLVGTLRIRMAGGATRRSSCSC